MRALIRSVTGSPASVKGKARREHSYSIGDIASSWTNIKNVLAASTDTANNHASSSTKAHTDDTSKQALASISQSLNIIVEGLVNEQSTLSSDDAGPCLEYVLTNNVFSNIAQAAVADQPVGVLGLIIRVFDNLVILLGEAFVTFGHRSLNHILHECIIHEDNISNPHVTGQAPSNAQLKIKSVAEPYEEELASLACSLCSRIKTQPDLLPLFFHDKRLSHRTKSVQEGKISTTLHVQNDGSPLSSPPASSHLSARPTLSQCSSQASLSSATSVSELSEASPTSSIPTTVESKQYTFLLFDFLIRLLHRHGRIGELARMGLLFIIDLAMSTAKIRIASNAAPPTFPELVSSKLKSTPATGTTKRSARKPKRKAVIGQSDRLSLLSYIEDSDFADVLGAGLGAAFAVLPSHVYVPIPGMSATLAEASVSPQSPTFEAHEGTSHTIREHGIAIYSDQEVKESLELFTAIIEFATDVTRKAPNVTKQDPISKHTPDTSTSSVSDRMQSLVKSIRASFGSVFLQNALVPRVLDAASPTTEDAAIIAVLTYIDTLIKSLVPETPLFEEALLGLLACQEGDKTVSKETSAIRDSLRRVLSYALTSHAGSKQSPSHHTGPLSNSLSTSMQLCALRLLSTLLERADWASLELFSIYPSIGCTTFPFHIPEDEGDKDAFVYPDDEDSDRDSFVYPNEEDHRKSIAAFTASAAHVRPRKTARQGLQLNLFLKLVSPAQKSATLPTYTERSHRKSSSRHSSKSSLDAPRSYADMTSHNGMSFEKYLKQAEISIQRDQSFSRGIAILAAAAPSQSEPVPSHNIPKILSMMSPSIQIGDQSMESGTSSLQSDATSASDGLLPPVEDRMVQHKLILHLGLLAQLDSLLSTFFINEPAVNLSLSRVLAKLAICPYRDLSGWLLPEGAGVSLLALQALGLIEKLGIATMKGDEGGLASTTTRQNNENSKVTDWLRQNSYTHQAVQDCEDSGLELATSNSSILARYATLLKEVEDSHRSQIKDFDRLLHERRQNMLFVEDLAEAMQGGSAASGSPLETSTSSWHMPFPSRSRTPASGVSSIRTGRQRVDSSATEREYLNSLSPYATHLRETASKLVMIRLEAPAEDGEYDFTNGQQTDGAPLSRFWSASSSRSDHNNEENGLSTLSTGQERSSAGLSPVPERLNLNTNTSLMLLSDLKSPIGAAGEQAQALYHEVPVNLSKYLDNLVILEESLKELVAIVIIRLRIGIDPIE